MGQTKIMKIVLDTNVIISGLLWKGLPGDVLEKCLKEHTLCFSIETLNEIRKALSYPKFIPNIQRLSFNTEEFLNRLTKNALIVSGTEKISVIKDDPSDNKFLACAISCQVNFIISGDQHLLKLKEFHKIPILQPKEFLKIIQKI